MLRKFAERLAERSLSRRGRTALERQHSRLCELLTLPRAHLLTPPATCWLAWRTGRCFCWPSLEQRR